jgi:hypothetical protein
MAFNVMARNCDDHTKHFGFILRAPAYAAALTCIWLIGIFDRSLEEGRNVW